MSECGDPKLNTIFHFLVVTSSVVVMSGVRGEEGEEELISGKESQVLVRKCGLGLSRYK